MGRRYLACLGFSLDFHFSLTSEAQTAYFNAYDRIQKIHSDAYRPIRPRGTYTPTKTAIIHQYKPAADSRVFAFYRVCRGTFRTRLCMHVGENWPSFRQQSCLAEPLTKKKFETGRGPLPWSVEQGSVELRQNRRVVPGRGIRHGGWRSVGFCQPVSTGIMAAIKTPSPAARGGRGAEGTQERSLLRSKDLCTGRAIWPGCDPKHPLHPPHAHHSRQDCRR
jgi:hypothetical protein